MKDILMNNLIGENFRLLKVKDVTSKHSSSGSNEKMLPKTSNDWSVVTRTKQKFSLKNNDLVRIGTKIENNCNNHLGSNKTRDENEYLLKRHLLRCIKCVVRPIGTTNSLCKNSENQIIISDPTVNRIKVFDLSGNLKKIVGSHKNGTPLESPRCIYMCPHTRMMVVVESPPYRMIKILVANLFTVTSFSYEATNPEDICMDSSFKSFLLDSLSRKIYIYDRAGVLLNVLHCPDFLYPCNIDVNQHEELFLCDKERHCVEVISYEGKKLRAIGGEGITDFPIFVKIGKNDEVIICNNYEILKITIFNRTGDTILVALQSMMRLEKLLDVTITCNGKVFVSTSDLNLFIMEFPLMAFKKLKWKKIHNVTKDMRNRIEYIKHEYPENLQNEIKRDEKSLNKTSVQLDHRERIEKQIIENNKSEVPNESKDLKDDIQDVINHISDENEQFEEISEMQLDNNDVPIENKNTEDDIWNMSFVTNVKIKNEELFDNILAQSQQFENCKRMLFETSEYAYQVESKSMEKDISPTKDVKVKNDESFNYISMESENLEENKITPFEKIDVSEEGIQDDIRSNPFKNDIHIRSIWSNSIPTQNLPKYIWCNVVLEHDLENHIRNIWSD
ncbi:hypothetical protein HELRODRAFT_166256 [Helobdella robusta]|uniref:Uncharacterized protein n=1 Tax=Helobdella robusta TaxID=6412 RepID=T1EXY4_HELRO|nr:hypothetical protein HELRODRAFT_166256 [Helobdella robusta]ESN90572.1 hypothetical protein HELRODRAFT_166256 [Helobdella robusta]